MRATKAEIDAIEAAGGHYYDGPSKYHNLRDLPNRADFKFTGIDKNGGTHYCIVRKDRGKYYMGSNTITYEKLIGWVEDHKNEAAK